MGVGPGTGVGGWMAGRQEGGEAAGPPSHTLGQTLWPLSMAAPRGPQEVPRAFPLEGRNPMSPGLCCPAVPSLTPPDGRGEWARSLGQLQMLRQAELNPPQAGLLRCGGPHGCTTTLGAVKKAR